MNSDIGLIATLVDKLGMSAWPKTNYCDSLSARKLIKSEIPFGAVFISLGYLCCWFVTCVVRIALY